MPERKRLGVTAREVKAAYERNGYDMEKTFEEFRHRGVGRSEIGTALSHAPEPEIDREKVWSLYEEFGSVSEVIKRLGLGSYARTRRRISDMVRTGISKGVFSKRSPSSYRILPREKQNG